MEKKPTIPKPEEKKSAIPIKFLLYGGAAVILILFLTAAAIPTFSNPTFCGSACHDGGPAQYKAWKKSSHSKITCYACHVEPGLYPLFKEKILAGSSGVYGILTGNYEKPVNAESKLSEHIPNELCERCHDVETRKFTYSRGLIMNHEPHLEAKLHCTTCHNRVAHLYITDYKKGEDPRHKYKNFMDMEEGCFRCHSSQKPYTAPNGKTAPTACVTCHNQDADLPIGHGKGWRTQHADIAKRDFGYCFRCHEKEVFCERCHEKGVEFPPTSIP